MKSYSIFSKGCTESIKIENELRKNIKLKFDDNTPDILFVIGGDGTILRAFHKYINIVDKITIFGIHTGHLGFLANYQQEDVKKIIDVINNKVDFKIENQTLIDFSLNNNGEIINGLALNEVSLSANPNMIELDVLIDNSLLETFRGGGLCISTPLGSTGYNKSLGGAVIDHNIECLQISELAGVNSNSYKTLMNSLVISGSRTVELKNVGCDDILFTFDNNSIKVNNFNSITIKSSNHKIKFAYIDGVNFVKRVNKAFL